MKKRVLSLLLLLAVVFSLLPATVLTANAADFCYISTGTGKISVKNHNYIYEAEPTVKEVRLWDHGKKIVDDDKHVVIPSVIGSEAFINCSDLESISLPRNCRTIGDRAFYGCDKLSFLYYDGPFDYIKRYFDHNDTYRIFYGSDGKPLKNLTVYVGRGSYRESDFPMFYGDIRIDCTSIGTDAWTPKNGKGMVYIDKYEGAIVGSTSDVEFDSLPKEIVEHTSGLINFHWPITYIDEYAFASCNFGVFTTKSSNISQIAPNAFYNCSKLFSVALPANDAFNKFSDGTPVGAYISPGAFRNCFRLENLTLAEPNSSSYSDDFMYGHWVLLDQSRKKLKMVPPATKGTFKVSEGIEVIDYFAFEQCGITEISLPKSLKEIGDCAFADVVSLKTLTIPKGVTKIGDEAAENVESIYFYGALPQLGERAFSNHAKLYYIPGKPGWPTSPIEMSINAPGGGTYHCYPWCEQSNPPGHTIEKVAGKAPTCTEDGYEEYWCCKTCSKLFSDANGTQQISTPRVRTATGHEWTWTIDKEATPTEAGNKHQKCDRCGATRYENTVIPKTHGDSVVAYEVEGGNIYFDTATGTVVAADKTVTGADIPEYIYGTRVTAIGDDAFNSLLSLKRVTLPEGLKKIGKTAFAWCSITTIVIPASVTEIGDAAFVTYGDSDALRSIYFLGDAPQFGDSAFYSDYDMDGFKMNKDRTLYFMEGKARWTTPKYGNYSNQDGLQAYPTQLWTHEHTLTHVPAVKAECEKDGNEEYWKCSKCYSVFADAEGSEQLDEIPVIPALGHNYQRKADDLRPDGAAKYHLECTRCGKRGASGTVAAHTHFFPPAQITPRVSATCTKIGMYATCKCKVCELTFYRKEFDKWVYLSKPTDVIIKALGHDIVKVEYAAPTCTEDGSREHWRCKRCGNTFADAAGNTPYNGETVIPALGHKWLWVTDTEATETAAGVKHEECFNCGEKRNEGTEIPMRAHTHSEVSEGGTLSAIPAKNPTCTEDGWQAYWECNTCRKKYADPKGSTEIAAPIVIPAAGHVLTHYEKEEATCTDTGRKERWFCDRCRKSFANASATTELDTIFIPALGHDPIRVLKKDATCTEDGWTSHVECRRCKALFEDYACTKPTNPTIPALGHNWVWNTVDPNMPRWQYCTRCGKQKNFSNEPQHTHKADEPHINKIAEVPATCTEAGRKEHYYCEICKKNFMYPTDGMIFTATPAMLRIDPIGHNWELVEKIEPTCTKVGWPEYYRCKNCGKFSLDSQGQFLMNRIRAISAKGHTLEAIPALTPTCTLGGYEAYWKCKDCEMLFSDSEGKNIIYAPEFLSPLGHKLTMVAEQAPTCTEKGSEAYWRCEQCNKLFADEAGQDEIKTAPEIPATGHAWLWVTDTEPTEDKPGVKHEECAVCHAKQNEGTEMPKLEHTHDLTAVAAKAPTCTEGGNEAYWRCTKCGKLYEDAAGTKELSALPVLTALGHKLTAVPEKAPTCTENGNEAYWKCERCARLFSDGNGENELLYLPGLKATGHTWDEGKVTTAPTCEKDGVKTITCTVCKETKTETIPATGKHHYGEDGKCEDCGKTEEQATCTHTWDEGKVTTEPTCDKDGVKTYTCTKCGLTKTEVIPATGKHHYGADGKCEDCGKTEEQATCTHTWDAGKVTTEPTCDKDGVKTYTCAKCGLTKTEVIPATGKHHYGADGKCEDCGKTEEQVNCTHTWDAGKVTTEPTCDKDGVKTFTCTRCEETKTETIPATGKHHYGEDGKCEDCGKTEEQATCTHTWNEGEVTTEPTCTADGEKTLTCTKCGSTKVVKLSALDHAWNEGEVTTAPTCDKDGVKTFTCTRCKETKTETIPATGKHHYGEDGKCEDCGKTEEQATCTHTWNEGEVTTEPTCDKDGVKTYTCAKCGLTKTEVIPATGKHHYGADGKCEDCGKTEEQVNCTHTWDEGKVTTEPTCDKDGVKTYTCAKCGLTKTEVIPATGKHHYGADGKCEDCGKTEEQVNCTHTWDEGKVTTEPTCDKDGVKTYTCTKCGLTKTEVIPATGKHHYGADGKCEDCGKTEEQVSCTHTWDEGKVTTEPTCDKDGVKTFTCTRCEETKTETIPATGKHHYGEDGKCEDCGKTEEQATCTHTWNEGEVTTEPTCTADGEKTLTCTKCGSTKVVKLSALDHAWNEGEVTTAPTCDKDGVKTFTCTRCKETKTETIPATGKHHYGEDGKCEDCGKTEEQATCTHTWNEGEVTTEPTCDKDGVKTYTCAKCGLTKTEVIPATGKHHYGADGKCEDCGKTEEQVNCTHTWDEGKVTTEPTCDKDGVKTYTCAKCGLTKTEVIPATGKHHYGADGKCEDCGKTEEQVNCTHTWDEGKVTTEPTCDKDGVKTYTCTKCGLTKTEVIPATGKHHYGADGKCEDCGKTEEQVSCTHTWDEGKVTTEPTCDKDGVKTYTCAKCGLTKTEVIPATGKHHYGADGKCEDCGKTEEQVNCTHTWNEGEVTTAPTCDKDGVKTYTCAKCGLTKTEVIPATGKHHYGADGKCEDCGKTEEQVNCTHTWDAGKVTTEPTCDKDGVKTYTCAKCGLTKTEVIPALGHNYVDGTCTNCGAADPNGGTELTCYFRDLDDCPYKWYHEPIDYVFANGLMNGVGDRRFAPEGTMTRAMMVTVLYRMAGSPEHTESSTFTDVASGRYYSTAIAWAQANNIVDGVGKGKFAPDAPVTREQIATILWRYEGKQSASADMSKFKDAGTISNYAREAMAWAVDKGLYIGDAGNLKPTTPATRAEFAILIMRYRGGSYPCPEIK